MSLGAKRLFSKFAYATAAAQHATIDISGCELHPDAKTHGGFGIRTIQQSGRDVGNAQITIFPKDSNFYLNKNHAWTVECWVRPEHLSSGGQPAAPQAPSGVHNLGPYTEGPDWRILIVHTSRLADDTRNQFVINNQFGQTIPPHASYGTDGTPRFRTRYENSSLGHAAAFPDANPNTSTHIAAVSTGTGFLKWFINGSEGTFSGYNQTYTYTGLNRNVALGLYEETNNVGFPTFNLYFDEIRISNTARYLANFTPQTTPFTPDKNVLALFHLENNTNDSSF